MPRIRVRMSEWEIGFVDLACAYYGLSRGEYMEHLVREIPCVPASRGASRDMAVNRKTMRRGTDEWSRRTQYVRLVLGACGRAALLAEARRDGVSVTEYVARHATKAETYFGTDVVCASLDAATTELGRLGITLNECARLANTAALVAAREPLDEGEFWTYVSDCCEYAAGARYNGRLLRRALDEVEAGLGGAGEKETGLVHGERGDARDCQKARQGERNEPGVLDSLPGLQGSKRTIQIRLSRDEVYELDDCREPTGLSRSKWVLLTCTPLYPDWRPIDVLSAHRLIVEMVRERTNAKQAMDALARAMERVPEVAAARDDVIDNLVPIAKTIDRALPVVRRRINLTRVVVRDGDAQDACEEG
jgi:hypothetical protein